MVAIVALVFAASRPGPAPAEAPAAGTPPDLSKMTPREQFTRLNDRVTAAAEQGDSLTVVRFWPMAAEAYTRLPPGDRDVDTHFHMAWLQLLAGQYPEAAALADTIMQESPGNLFGYYVRASIAEARGDSAAARLSRAAFREHFDAEMKRTDRTEYADHRTMLQKLRSDST